MAVTFLTNEDRTELENRVDQLSAEIGDTPTDTKFFDIDYDGIVSLKPEYRGSSTDTDYPYSISDNGSGNNGSKFAELPEIIVFPEIIGDTAVMGFQAGMFYHNWRIKEIVFPKSVSVIPDMFCRNTAYLRSISNTEHISELGARAFMNSGIKKAPFPSLKVAGDRAFCQCPLLVIADIGDEIETISERMFINSASLFCIKGGASVKSVMTKGFQGTLNLKKVPFLSQLTYVGDCGFFNSRVDFDWSSLTNCTFGVTPTPVADNTTDYWSECTFTPCENVLNTLLHQRNPEWADQYYGTTTVKYSSGGCPIMSALHIHSALSGKTYVSPKQFEAELRQIDASLLNLRPGSGTNLATIIAALGYSVTTYTSKITSTIYQTLLDAIARGAYAYLTVSSASNIDGGHAVVIYGVNAIGEILIADSDNMYEIISIYDDGFRQHIPIQNYTGPSSQIVIVEKTT